jgi:hypothetical protein
MENTLVAASFSSNEDAVKNALKYRQNQDFPP